MHGDNHEFWSIESIPASPSESAIEHSPFTDITEDTSVVRPLHDDLTNISPDVKPPSPVMEGDFAAADIRYNRNVPC